MSRDVGRFALPRGEELPADIAFMVDRLIQQVFIVDELTRERDRLDRWGTKSDATNHQTGRRARGDCQDARRWDRAVAYTDNLLEQFRTRAGACGGLSEKHWTSGHPDAVSHCVIGGHRRFRTR
jgi:hypothetical protein